ncbi:MAG: DUF3108 domain-containing protein [Gammaproteobacteria bacterium]
MHGHAVLQTVTRGDVHGLRLGGAPHPSRLPIEVEADVTLDVLGAIVRHIADRARTGCTEDIKRDIRLDFDWKAGRVRGTAEAQPVDIASRDGLQDGMSVQIALIRALTAGERPRRYFLIDKDEIKEYVYEQEGTARIRTTAGELDTVIWSSRRPNSDRVTRVWYATALDHTPVQAERRRGDKVEWTTRLKSLQR